MRNRSAALKRHGIRHAVDQVLIQQEMVREFRAAEVDLDALTQAIRQLLDSGDTADLLSPDH
jgi:hypothetical protein